MTHRGWDEAWRGEAEAIVSGMQEWRVAQPQATWPAIEAAGDARLDGMRARRLADVALASRPANVSGHGKAGRATCGAGGSRLVVQGQPTRQGVTPGGREVTLRRD